jgi:hypothetical protein
MSSIPSYLQSLEAALQGNTNGATTIPTSALPSFLTATSELASNSTGNSSVGSKHEKLKFLLVGTHAHQFTGYSKVTYGFLKVLAKHPSLSLTHF